MAKIINSLLRKSIVLLALALISLNPPVPAYAESGSLPANPPASNVPQPPSPDTPTASVMFDGEALFTLIGLPPALSAEERAAIVGARLKEAAKSDSLSRIKITEADGVSEIYSGDILIVRITGRDGELAKLPREKLAADIGATAGKALEEHRKNYNLQALILGGVYFILATIVLGLLLWANNYAYRQGLAKIELIVEEGLGGKVLPLTKLVSAARVKALLRIILKWARLAAGLTLFYFYIPLVLGFFPFTAKFADSTTHYMLSPFISIVHSVWNYLPKLVFLAALWIVTHYSLKLMKYIFGEIEAGTLVFPGFFAEWAQTTYKIMRFLALAFVAVVAFPYLPGAESEAFKGVSIFIGVLFSIGSSSAVANVVAGVLLTYMRAFSIGDRVKIAETVGDVTGKSLLVTRIKTIKNVEITIPNSLVLGSHITNFSANRGKLILNTGVTIGYDVPWRQVHELLVEAASKTPHVLNEPKPFVLQTALNDFYVAYEINAYTDQPGRMAATYSELHQNIQDVFNTAGVEIMSQHFLGLRDGNTVTIPEKHRPEGYETPPFRVEMLDGEKAPEK